MRILGIVFILISVCTFSKAQSKKDLADRMNTINTSVAFLTIAPDSKAGSLGDGGVATDPDMNSRYWNASKYAFIESNFGVSLSYAPWLRGLGISDINLLYLTGHKKLDSRQVISASIGFFSLGEITFTDVNGISQGDYSPSEFSIDAAYSLKLSENLSGSLGFRFIRSDLTGGRAATGDDETRAGMAGAADLGFYYRKDVNISDKNGSYALGINISNMGNKITYFEDSPASFLPTMLRLGGQVSVFADEYNSFKFHLELSKYLVPTTPIFKIEDGQTAVDDNGNYIIEFGKNPDVSVPKGIFQSFYDAPGGLTEELNEIIYSSGIEYLYREQFAIRAGYFHEHENKGNRKYATMGVGIKLNVFGLDFSYLAPIAGRQSPLANTVRFTLTFDFDSYNRNVE